MRYCSTMADLLCITPWPGLKTHYGRIAHNLLPRWAGTFDTISVWSTYGGPGDDEVADYAQEWHGAKDEPLMKRLPQLGKLLSAGTFSHTIIIGDLDFLDGLAGLGVTSDNLNDTLLYAYAIIDTSLVDSRYAGLPSCFDFFICMSGMAMGAMKELVIDQAGRAPKQLISSVMSTKFILPGVDDKTFRPLSVARGEPSYEEIREAMFGRRLNSQDLLITVSGMRSRRKGLPQAFAMLAELNKLLDGRRKAKMYLHMPCRPNTANPLNTDILVGGNGLEPHVDVLYGDGFFTGGEMKLSDEDLNLIYNASDIVLSPDLAGGWPFTITEAMAAGTLVAAPDEHVWLDAIGDGGIALPCTEFGWAPWSSNEYVRAIDPAAGARAIFDVVSDPSEYSRRADLCKKWVSEQLQWDRCASEWELIFGVG